MSYFQGFYDQSAVSGTDARQTKMFIERMKEQDRARKDQSKALAEDQKRLGMIAQGMGLEKGEVDSMSRGELSGFIENTMNQVQRDQQRQKNALDLGKFVQDQERVDIAKINAEAQLAFGNAQKSAVEQKGEQAERFLETEKNDLNAKHTILKNAKGESPSPSPELLNALETFSADGMSPKAKQEAYDRYVNSLDVEEKIPDIPFSLKPTFDEAQKDMQDFMESGGFVKNRDRVNRIQELMEQVSIQPDTKGSLFEKTKTLFFSEEIRQAMGDPKISTKQKYELLIQEGLRETLGAQFTENEAIQFFKRAYDPLATNEDLIDRMTTFMQEIINKTDFQMQRFGALEKSLTTGEKNHYLEFMSKGYTPGASGFPPAQSGKSLKSGNRGSVLNIPGVQQRN